MSHALVRVILGQALGTYHLRESNPQAEVTPCDLMQNLLTFRDRGTFNTRGVIA